jgi:hypothetical protein
MNIESPRRPRGGPARTLASVCITALMATVPVAVFADDVVHFRGSISVSALIPSATDYCISGGTPIEAQGVANLSGLGPVYVTVKKCLTFPHGLPMGTWTGTLMLRAANGDTLASSYVGTEDFSLGDSNGFTPGQGTATITGGTGEFAGATGTISFSFVQCPSVLGGDGKTVVAAVFYLLNGNIVLADRG